MYRQINWIGYSLFFLLSLAAIVLFKERVIYVDSAYYAFNLYNEGMPVAEHNRYALYIYQLLPWLMMKLGFSVAMVLRMYSLSHVLVHLIAFVILLRLKQPKMALLLLIMQVVGYRECFFLTVNETALAISSTLLFAAYIEHFEHHKSSLTKRVLIYLILLLIALFSHPMAMILLPFVLGYHLVRYRFAKEKIRSLIPPVLVLSVVFLFRKLVSKESGYEDDLFAQLNHTAQILGNLKDIYSFKFFTGEFKPEAYFFQVYFMPVLATLLVIVLYLRKRQYLQLFYYLLSSLAFWLLIIILFNRGDGNIFMEKNFTPWILVSFYPLKDLLEQDTEKLPWATYFATLFIIVFSLYGVSRVTPMYQKRLYLMDRLICEKNEGHSKLLIQDSTVNHDEWLGIWALPYETILLSAVKKMPIVTAKIYHNEETINKELGRKDIFLGADFIPVLTTDYLIKNPKLKPLEETYHAIEKP